MVTELYGGEKNTTAPRPDLTQQIHSLIEKKHYHGILDLLKTDTRSLSDHQVTLIISDLIPLARELNTDVRNRVKSHNVEQQLAMVDTIIATVVARFIGYTKRGSGGGTLQDFARDAWFNTDDILNTVQQQEVRTRVQGSPLFSGSTIPYLLSHATDMAAHGQSRTLSLLIPFVKQQDLTFISRRKGELGEKLQFLKQRHATKPDQLTAMETTVSLLSSYQGEGTSDIPLAKAA